MGNNNCNWTEQKTQPPSGAGSGGLQPLQRYVSAEVYRGFMVMIRLTSVIGGDVWQIVTTTKMLPSSLQLFVASTRI